MNVVTTALTIWQVVGIVAVVFIAIGAGWVLIRNGVYRETERDNARLRSRVAELEKGQQENKSTIDELRGEIRTVKHESDQARADKEACNMRLIDALQELREAQGKVILLQEKLARLERDRN